MSLLRENGLTSALALVLWLQRSSHRPTSATIGFAGAPDAKLRVYSASAIFLRMYVMELAAMSSAVMTSYQYEAS